MSGHALTWGHQPPKTRPGERTCNADKACCACMCWASGLSPCPFANNSSARAKSLSCDRVTPTLKEQDLLQRRVSHAQSQLQLALQTVQAESSLSFEHQDVRVLGITISLQVPPHWSSRLLREFRLQAHCTYQQDFAARQAAGPQADTSAVYD